VNACLGVLLLATADLLESIFNIQRLNGRPRVRSLLAANKKAGLTCKPLYKDCPGFIKVCEHECQITAVCTLLQLWIYLLFDRMAADFWGCQLSLSGLALAWDSRLHQTPVCLVETESLLSTFAAALIACTYEDLRYF
jgi:hypothetical protein